MTTVTDLVARCDAFANARGLKRSYASTIIFNDGKRLDALAAGAGITVKRLEQALARLGQLETGEIEARRPERAA